MVTHRDDRPYSCSICFQTFKLKQGLRIHSEIHARDFALESASLLPGTAGINGNLEMSRSDGRSDTNLYGSPYQMQHREQPKIDIDPLECPFCSRKLHSDAMMDRHLRSGVCQKVWICTICSKKLKDKSSLRKHEEMHNRQKQNPCTICGQQVNRNVDTDSQICCTCSATNEGNAASVETGEDHFITIPSHRALKT
ncbi:hypothetical protein QAD02_010875 [Eretmocerus hayati]|uniref:Uncharacterized protein n=1 Tax=Eretmocerus hayati TaxID=131215 RepID=A0ACC2NVF1_9HYME|nr:hypothetical protein QAD02_010875 [Eretmocerus hayati]